MSLPASLDAFARLCIVFSYLRPLSGSRTLEERRLSHGQRPHCTIEAIAAAVAEATIVSNARS